MEFPPDSLRPDSLSMVAMASEPKRAKTNLQAVIYILPAKIQKVRLKILTEGAKKNGIIVRDSLTTDVTHIVSEYESREQVFEKLDVKDCTNEVEVVNTGWLSESIKAGYAVDVHPQHRLKAVGKREKEDESSCTVAEYACQRSTPLNHPNQTLSEALELLEEHAEYKDDYSRSLAFRRASSTVKSLPFPVKRIQQLKGMPHLGKHCERVIKEILEDGYSAEVEEIFHSDWYKKMKMFTGVFGVGPSTASKWIEQGFNTIEDVRTSTVVQRKDDSRVAMGLAFYEDLNLPVTLAEAKYLQKLIETEVKDILPGATVEMTGGFRRGKTSGHDVDFLLSHPEEGTEVTLLEELLVRLQKKGLIIYGNMENNTITEDVLKGETKGAYLKSTLDHFQKWIGVIKLDKNIRDGKKFNDMEQAEIVKHSSLTDNSKDSPPHSAGNVPRLERTGSSSEYLESAGETRDWYARRMDLIAIPQSQYYYALVGWTGSKHFNRSLRLYAQRELNSKLTSHALYDMTQKVLVPARSEKEVFDNLKLEYREPQDRNC